MNPLKIWTFPLLLPRKPCFSKSTTPINSKGFSEFHMNTEDFIGFSVISKNASQQITMEHSPCIGCLGIQTCKDEWEAAPRCQRVVVWETDHSDSRNTCRALRMCLPLGEALREYLAQSSQPLRVLPCSPDIKHWGLGGLRGQVVQPFGSGSRRQPLTVWLQSPDF